MPMFQPLTTPKPEIVLCNGNHHSPEELSPSPPQSRTLHVNANGCHRFSKKLSAGSMDTDTNGNDPSPPRYGQWEEVLLSTSPFVTGFLHQMSVSWKDIEQLWLVGCASMPSKPIRHRRVDAHTRTQNNLFTIVIRLSFQTVYK